MKNITKNNTIEKFTAWRLKSTSSFKQKTDFARIAKRWVGYQCEPRDIGVSHASAQTMETLSKLAVKI